MSNQPNSTLAKRVRAAKPRDQEYLIHDEVVTRLGLAVQLTGVRTVVINRMVHGRRRYATVGRADTLTVPEARTGARRIIADSIGTGKNDDGLRTPGHPMGAFVTEFLDRQARH